MIKSRNMSATEYTILEYIKYTTNIEVNDIHTTYQLLKKLIYIDINKNLFNFGTFNGNITPDARNIIFHYNFIEILRFNDGLLNKNDLLELQSLEHHSNTCLDMINKIKTY